MITKTLRFEAKDGSWVTAHKHNYGYWTIYTSGGYRGTLDEPGKHISERDARAHLEFYHHTDSMIEVRS